MSLKLSVCFITYNHEKFVRQALESVLMQQCDFDFEIVIGNDCSTDGTTAIVEEFAKKYPQKIRLNRFEKNIGMTGNWVSTMTACRGEYVAMLEGDDFWTDPTKLQKQVTLLDSRPEISFVCHDVETIFEEGVRKRDPAYHMDKQSEFTIHDILDEKWFIPTCSMVYRKSCLPPFPKWVDARVKCIDLFVKLMLSAQNSYLYTNEKMGKYRIHEGGISQHWKRKLNTYEYDVINVLRLFNGFSNYKFNEEINDRVERHYHVLLHQNKYNSFVYNKALFGLMRVRPQKNMTLFKGWLIHNFIPAKIYSTFKKTS